MRPQQKTDQDAADLIHLHFCTCDVLGNKIIFFKVENENQPLRSRNSSGCKIERAVVRNDCTCVYIGAPQGCICILWFVIENSVLSYLTEVQTAVFTFRLFFTSDVLLLLQS